MKAESKRTTRCFSPPSGLHLGTCTSAGGCKSCAPIEASASLGIPTIFSSEYTYTLTGLPSLHCCEARLPWESLMLISEYLVAMFSPTSWVLWSLHDYLSDAVKE